MTSLEEIQDRIYRPMPITVAYRPTLGKIRALLPWISDTCLLRAGVVPVSDYEFPDRLRPIRDWSMS